MSFSSSSTKDYHSFHDCPLRSSSLLIVNTEKQTIITATDEVFDILGYDPAQLVGKSIHLLNPTLRRFHLENKQEEFTLLHESLGQLPFDICIHHDPLTSTIDLDYWLIRPIHKTAKQQPPKKTTITEGPVTILRLSPFGTIEHAYPSKQFPQQTHQLKGHPIMSFVHKSDVRSLCEKLANIKRKKAYLTFSVRWLNKHHPRQLLQQHAEKEKEEDYYDWVSFTVMNSPRNQRLSCDSANDPQSRPICVIQPSPKRQQYSTATPKQQECRTSTPYLVPYLLTGLMSGTVKLLWEGTSLGINSFLDLMEAMHTALDQGKVYMIEFLAHLLTHAIKMMHEVIYVTSWEDCGHQESSSASSSSDDSDYYSEENVEYINMNTGGGAKWRRKKDQTKKRQQKKWLHEKKRAYEGLSSIRVSIDDNSIWSVPLLVKEALKYNSLTATTKTIKSLCNGKKH